MIDWVSPLRPDRTDVAEYSHRVQTALQGRFALNLIAPSRAGALDAYALDGEPFFNIGNDARFHAAILQASHRTSGIIIAHDYRIQDLIIASFAHTGEGWQGRYQAAMRRVYGPEGEAAAKQLCQGKRSTIQLSGDFPGIEFASENAVCVISHNPALVDNLAQRTGLYCAHLPLPFPLPAKQHAPPAPDPEDKHLDLLLFGYIGANRGADLICDVLSEMQNSRFRLNVAGIPGAGTRAKLDAFATRGTLIDHGFMEETQLDRLIRRCALVLNLRYPSMGEVSGSQLRILANGGLSVVTDEGWYSSLPDDCVIKLKHARVKEELSQVLRQLTENPAVFDGYRERGHQYVGRHHSLEYFASAFDAFMAQSHEALSHGRKLLLADRIRMHYGVTHKTWPRPASYYLERAEALV